MTLNLSMPRPDHDLKPRITVFGVGGAGGNAVNNMIEKCLEGVDFVVANTDAQALAQSNSEERIQLGVKVTEGLGAGAKAAVGAAAAEENIEQIVDQLAGAHMCFITAGMGGGTGTGAAPIIAQAARELGVLTVGVVTKPFQFEGSKRMRQAEEGVEALQKMVDTLIIIPNQNLFRLANEKTTFTEAFSMADDVLYQGVKGVTDLMVRPGLINLDFADVRAVMDEMGKAMMGTGEDNGEERAVQAAEKAIANPLLDEISLRGARGVLINITGGYDLTLFELDEAANRIREEVDAEANIIVGSTLDPNMDGVMRVSVVATGIDANQEDRDVPLPRRSLAEPLRPEAALAQSEVASEDLHVDDEFSAPTSEVAAEAPLEVEPNLFDGFDPNAVAEETSHDEF
ncbi:MAG: cell division protein FtsZ, partial [Pseudomonadota bacterium]